MRILLITQWFPPIKGAAATRTAKMARMLSAAGHKVMVLTGFPSYPTGILPQKYHWKLWTQEKDGQINILRVYEYPTAAQGTINRLINMFSFAFFAGLAALVLPVFDAVIVSSPSFLSGIAGLFARREKCQFYFDVRDLWPDSAIQLGFLKQDILIDLAKKLEQKYYRDAKKIMVATPEIKRHLTFEKVPATKIEVLLNSTDTQVFKPRPGNREEFGFKNNDFIAGYVGNHSRVYDLETIIKAAKLLAGFPRIKFLFVGEGETKERCQKLAQKLELSNVKFIGEVPLEKVAEIINLSDIGLIPLAPIRVSQYSFPVKASEYFASAKPVVAAISGNMAKIIKDNQVGLFYLPGKADQAAAAILKLYRQPKLRQKMGQNARKLALKMFSDKIFAQKLCQIF